jgi:hypothetical protein
VHALCCLHKRCMRQRRHNPGNETLNGCRWRQGRRGGRGRLVRRLPERAAQPGGHARALWAHHAGAHCPERDGALMHTWDTLCQSSKLLTRWAAKRHNMPPQCWRQWSTVRTSESFSAYKLSLYTKPVAWGSRQTLMQQPVPARAPVAEVDSSKHVCLHPVHRCGWRSRRATLRAWRTRWRRCAGCWRTRRRAPLGCRAPRRRRPTCATTSSCAACCECEAHRTATLPIAQAGVPHEFQVLLVELSDSANLSSGRGKSRSCHAACRDWLPCRQGA